jgi:hypothetical protein
MISVQFTYDEVQALVDFIWGEESDQEALRTANDKLTAALDSKTPGRPASGNCKLNPGCLVSRSRGGRTLAGAWLVRKARVCHHEHAARFRK